MRPGAVLDLVREPENPHDENSVAVMAGGQRIGRINKQMAVRLSKRIREGDRLATVSLAGAGPGVASERDPVLPVSPRLLKHLRVADRAASADPAQKDAPRAP